MCGRDQQKVFKKIINVAFYENSFLNFIRTSAHCHKGHNVIEGLSCFLTAYTKILCILLANKTKSEAYKKSQKLLVANDKIP